MKFDTPLSGGLLIVGSLLWDEHETRFSLRDEVLNMQNATIVPAPIRYGRKSDKRQTYTMVVSPSCKDESRMGKGVLVPFAANIKSTDELTNVAEKIIVAEHKGPVSFTRFNWGWGCLAFFPNPNKTASKSISQLKEFWDTKISNGFRTSDYIITNEEELLTQQGELLLDWRKEYGDLDFLVVTATKPTVPSPTTQLLGAVYAKNDEYFADNRKAGIETYQDNEIQEQINLNHEEKS